MSRSSALRPATGILSAAGKLRFIGLQRLERAGDSFGNFNFTASIVMGTLGDIPVKTPYVIE